uniref:Ixodegrin B n=1 Tax=Rhipicephalus appendiculatus TaxID=34631 RepID=A0A131YHY4_RHIAP
MAVLYVVVSAVALYLCMTSAAMGEATETKKAQEGESCDGNGDCDKQLCCYRPGPQNGTVCGKLGNRNEPCSNVTLEEHTTPVQPSCRDDEQEAESTATTEAPYSPPYDLKCPCAADLTCHFSKVNERSLNENVDSSGQESGKVQLGTCSSPETLKESER